MGGKTIRVVVVRTLLSTLALMLMPAPTFAQSGIAGLVTDASGGVLPGVTVEATSPVLIEKIRTVATDGEGRYSIVDLRPGSYTVTFALAGFNTVRREGISLPAAFTATVNAELKVGGVEETITVSGQSPVVDVQNVTKQAQFSKELVDSLPTARTPQGFAAFVPGVTGGLNVSGVESRSVAIHGSTSGEAITAVDGFPDTMIRGVGGGNSTFYMNPLNIQEVNVVLGANPAEQQIGGVFANVVPREGSNTLRGALFGSFSNGALEMDNLTPALKAQGLSQNGLKDAWDFSPAFGGRLIKDKLWFWGSYRESDLTRYIAGLYYNLDRTAFVYAGPDLSRPAYIKITDGSRSLRLTWQAMPKHQISASYEKQPHVVYQRSYAATRSPESTGYTPYIPNYVAQVVWKSPTTNRLLLDAGVSAVVNDYNGRRQNEKGGVPGTGDFDTLQKTESSTGFIYGSGGDIGHHVNRGVTSRASATYVTGSHAFKSGFQMRAGSLTDSQEVNGDMTVTLLRGVPNRLTLMATPYTTVNWIKADLGVYGQDRWTYKHLTLNLGIRFDYYNGYSESVNLPATRFVPARQFPAQHGVPDWKDISPRIGGSYDLFGDGKTAIKAGIYRFVIGQGASQLTAQTNPVSTSVLSTNRNWTDVNNNHVPDCDLTNPVAQDFTAGGGDICGAIDNNNFGKANPKATTYDPAVLEGWGSRGYNWETSVELQHELRPGFSINAGYFRRWFGNLTVTDNTLLGAGDFDPYCVTVPVDSRLPGGGGKQLCGYYDVKPTRFGASQNVVTFAKNFGAPTQMFNGVDISGDIRLGRGVRTSGGVSMGRTSLNSCYVVDSPQELLFCDQTPPFQPNIKALLVYPLPWWGVQTSATLQSIPGPSITASRVYSNAEISPSLNRNLASGANGTVTLNVIQPGTVFNHRVSQLDFRLAKDVKTGENTRIRPSIDIFNLFNASYAQTQNNTYGSSWLKPLTILGGRNFRFNVQVDF